MSECSTDLNDLFNLLDVNVATVDVVTYSSDGSKEGLISGDIIGEGDGMSGATEWRWHLTGGIRTWN